MKRTFLSAVALAASLFAGSASAIPIVAIFNVATGAAAIVADTGNVNTATTITNGATNSVGFVQASNIGLIFGQTVIVAPDPVGVTLGSVFTKTFTTELGTFQETLTVNRVNNTQTGTLGVFAAGTIVQTAGTGFDPTPVFWSSAYTQNGGAGQQINVSFNNSTDDPEEVVPVPGTVALLGLGLLGLGAARRRKA